LAPVPYRGKRNEPIYINEVAQKIGDVLQMSKEAVVEQTTMNSRLLFLR
jgi:TatD DNase family protein